MNRCVHFKRQWSVNTAIWFSKWSCKYSVHYVH